jgi:hypothetical protein
MVSFFVLTTLADKFPVFVRGNADFHDHYDSR